MGREKKSNNLAHYVKDISVKNFTLDHGIDMDESENFEKSEKYLELGVF